MRAQLFPRIWKHIQGIQTVCLHYCSNDSSIGGEASEEWSCNNQVGDITSASQETPVGASGSRSVGDCTLISSQSQLCEGINEIGRICQSASCNPVVQSALAKNDTLKAKDQ